MRDEDAIATPVDKLFCDDFRVRLTVNHIVGNPRQLDCRRRQGMFRVRERFKAIDNLPVFDFHTGQFDDFVVDGR